MFLWWMLLVYRWLSHLLFHLQSLSWPCELHSMIPLYIWGRWGFERFSMPAWRHRLVNVQGELENPSFPTQSSTTSDFCNHRAPEWLSGYSEISFQSLHSDKSCVWYVESQSDYEQPWPLSGVRAGRQYIMLKLRFHWNRERRNERIRGYNASPETIPRSCWF